MRSVGGAYPGSLRSPLAFVPVGRGFLKILGRPQIPEVGNYRRRSLLAFVRALFASVFTARSVPRAAPAGSSPLPGSLCADDGETTRPWRSSAFSVPYTREVGDDGRRRSYHVVALRLVGVHKRQLRCPTALSSISDVCTQEVGGDGRRRLLPCCGVAVPVRSGRSLRTVGSVPDVPFHQTRTFTHFRNVAWPFIFRRAECGMDVRSTKHQVPSAKCKVLSAKCGAVGRRASR